MSAQPEALRLADRLTAIFENAMWVNYGAISKSTVEKAAAELRRQHAEIERLREVGVGYSQQTMDAVVREREKLREANAELLEALRGMVALEEGNLRGGDDDDISIELRCARAAIAKAEGVKP